jgi:LasA protease
MKLNRVSMPILFLVFILLLFVSCIFLIVFIYPTNSVIDTKQILDNNPNKPTSFKSSSKQTPTPDPPRVLQKLRSEPVDYMVQPGDTLGKIAKRYLVSVGMIIEENQIVNPDLIEVGQVFTIPAAEPGQNAPGFKIIPDSELINGPSVVNFDTNEFIQLHGGYLSAYQEEYKGKIYSGAEIIEKISNEYSVNPRILIATLEFMGNWLTIPNINEESQKDPFLILDPNMDGLYKQLSWVANELNRGYYLWKINALPALVTKDEIIIPMDPTINAGTASIQYLFSQILEYDDWKEAVQSEGFFQTYEDLFGYPFNLGSEPNLPGNLSQPVFQLPFELGKEWSFTGGPHAGWGDGSAWAALDFAPPTDSLGCIPNDEWVVAIADGLIIYSDDGMVIQDLDSDGWYQTGWSILYMHIESRDRVDVGTNLESGDKIGHASCEGGISSGTHLHIARRYNGEWISADQELPFVMDNWVSKGSGTEYDGFLIRENAIVEAINGKETENQIKR